MTPRGAALLGIAVALAAPAAASAASFSIATAASLVLDAEVGVSGRGQTFLRDDAATGERRLLDARGTVGVWTREAVVVPSRPPILQDVSASSRQFVVDGGALLFAADGGRWSLTAVSTGGVSTVEGRVTGAGKPVWLAREVDQSPGVGLSDVTGERTDWVPYRWPAGTPFVGEYAEVEAADLLGDAPSLSFAGDFEIQVLGGNATFRDAEGALHTVRLGSWNVTGPLGEARRRDAHLVFRGSADADDLPLRGTWGFGAPELAWRVDGSATFSGATGTVEHEDGTERFDDRVVTLAGDVTFVPQRTGGLAGAFSPVEYVGEGDVRSLAVDGRGVDVAARAPDAATAALWAGALAAAALAAKAAAFAYTRIARESALDHPTRRRIYDAALAEPGLHKSELQRRVGGAWGPLTFHLAVLAKLGYVRLEGTRYTTRVWPPAVTGAPAALTHPVRRAVYAGLPPDGSAVLAVALRDRLGLSRQLLDHHLSALQREGWATRADTPEGRAFARRAGT